MFPWGLSYLLKTKPSIIAVHGLNPWSKPDDEHAWDTWRKPAGPGGRLWLRDDLKEKALAARVFLYQYDSKLLWGGDKASFVLKADELLEAIRLKRKKVHIVYPLGFTKLTVAG